MSSREIKIYRDVSGVQEAEASDVRALLQAHGAKMLNLIGSPGSGKTALLEAMGRKVGADLKGIVLEGDVETTRDAERLAAVGVPVVQLNTGGGCHLSATLVHHALSDLPWEDYEWVFTENVGNLVCPTHMDIGELAKIAVLSVTEGEDKPLKYPMLFREAAAAVITKIDLLPHLSFDLDECLGYLRQINPQLPLFPLSATTGEGLDEWLEWLGQL